VLLAVSVAGCKRSQKEITVGAFLPLSGSDATFGSEARDGMELAVDQLDAAGGIKKKKVRLVVEDDHSAAAEVSQKVHKLIDEDHAIGLVGEIASSRTVAGGDVASQKHVPLISPSATAEGVTKGDYVFRSCFNDAQQGDVAARFTRESLLKTKAAVFYAEDDAYSRGLAQSFKDSFAKYGGRVVSEKGYRKTDTNFAAALAELKAQSPEVYFVPVYYNDMVQIARQALLIRIPAAAFVGGDGWDSPVLAESAGAELEGAHFTSHFVADAPGEAVKPFVDAFQKKFGHPPSSLAAQGYDAIRVLFDAIGRAEGATPEAVRTAVAETKNFQGPTGILTIDAHHDANKPVVVVEIKNKKFTYATQLLSR
jgi:branched-chain amino acid transport system substrate-binding protein